MNLYTVAWTYLRGRWLATILTTFSVALGVSLIIAMVLLTQGIRDAFITGTTDYNLLIGAKSSATQMVFNVIFRLDTATPNIPYTVYEQLRADARVARAVPVAMGDAYQGFRYVATTTTYFAAAPWQRKAFALAAGHFWQDEAIAAPHYKAVLGAEVAQRTGLRLGEQLYEGEEMVAYPLTVVGILRPTHSADDRAIFLSLASFWDMNELARHLAVKPLTAVLVRPERLSDLPALHREYNLHPDVQAVFPSAVLLTVFNILSLVEEILTYVLAVMALVVLLYVGVALYTATLERTREIATMRALGARRMTVLAIVLLEAGFMTVVGGSVGVVGGHGVAALGAHLLSLRGGLAVSPFQLSVVQPLVLGGVVLLGTGAGLLPALLAYRTAVAENLTPLS